MSGVVDAIFGGGKKPKAPEPPPSVDHASAQTAADKERRRAAAARGMAATMLTNPGQLTSGANIGTRQLLGR